MGGSTSSPVDLLHQEIADLLAVLDESGKVSLRIVADENLRKSMLLAAASYFEHRITESVLQFVRDSTNQNLLVGELVRNKAVKRQYHTWFQWERQNANSFFGLFGSDFRDFMGQKVKDEKLEDAVRAFLELARERNRLVHENYGAFPLEKTAREIHELYCRARIFIEIVPQALREFDSDRPDRTKLGLSD